MQAMPRGTSLDPMSQLVLVIHGAGEPRRRGRKVYWEPLLGNALGPAYRVQAPRMPDPENPDDRAWRERIAQLVREAVCPVLVGHSFGASTLLRFLAQGEAEPAFRGLFLVATPFWGENLPDFALTAEHLRRLQSISPLFFYQSADDPIVGRSHFQKYQQFLPHAVFRLLDGRGHEFDQDSFPELVADVRSVTGASASSSR
jgi:predicted alpha/beta hydrolase family esterase